MMRYIAEKYNLSENQVVVLGLSMGIAAALLLIMTT
jgi:predicted peptidase